jgi:quinohemoprotein amine dehydrogenase beta subunit
MRILSAALAASLIAAPAMAKDLLVTIAKPGTLYVFDAAARALERECPLEMNTDPAVIVMSPDGRTAYALVNRWSDVIGIDITTCERVFYAAQSEEGIRRKSMASIAVSPDGSELYTIRNPTRLLKDRYQVLEPELAVYDTAAGLEAEPKRVLPAPRRSTVMATGADGTLYVGGHDIYAIDPATGAQKVAIANANWDRPTHSPPDVLAFWPIGTQNNEFLLMYTAAVFTDATQQELADFVWGYSSVDLATGKTAIADFASLEVLMFTGVRSPQAPEMLYGVYTQLSKHNLETRELVKRVDLPHTYYVINVSSDGSEVYVGGTNDDIGVYSTETLERIGEMRIPTGGDMTTATLQIARTE